MSLRTPLILVCVLAAAACGGAAPPPGETAPQRLTSDVQGVVVASHLVVGDARLPIGVLVRNSPVNDARVRVRVYRQSANDPLLSESDAPFKGEGLEGKGIYVARVKFGAPGAWLAEISTRLPSGIATASRVPVNVLAAPTVPWVGQPAPRSRNPTAKDVADVSLIDSGRPPNDMHELSVAEAIERQRPALVVFATPAFCQSQMCGPQVHAVQQLEPAYRDRLAFIHVEVFTDFKPDPSKMRVSATFLEWRLQSEPWVFLIDANGVIRAAFEGPTATDELRDAVERLLAAR